MYKRQVTHSGKKYRFANIMQGLCCVTKQHRAVVIDAGDSDSIYSYVGSGQQNGVRSTGSTTKPENRGSPAGIVNTMTCRGFSEITCYHCEGNISCRCLFSGNRCRRFRWSGAFFHGLEIDVYKRQVFGVNDILSVNRYTRPRLIIPVNQLRPGL